MINYGFDCYYILLHTYFLGAALQALIEVTSGDIESNILNAAEFCSMNKNKISFLRHEKSFLCLDGKRRIIAYAFFGLGH